VAGEATPPSYALTGPAPPRRLVCAPGVDAPAIQADRVWKARPMRHTS